MITLIHGQNTALSRKYYSNIKQAAKNPITMEGNALTVTDLAQTLEGKGLFDDKQDIFIEEFFSKRKQSKETDALLLYLANHQKDNVITIWESKDVTPTQLKALKNAKVQKFDFPKILFTFLDALKPKNGKYLLQLFHQLLETEEPEFIFFMIVRHIRILLALSEPDETNQIDEVKRLAPWQMGKLQKQMLAFGKEKLIELYSRLFEIEQGMKTGQLAMPVTAAIDFLLITI